MQPEENPFRALIEAEMVLERIHDDRAQRALKLVRSALAYLRTHPIGEYVDPQTRDPRD
jgi:hypothetical protein